MTLYKIDKGQIVNRSETALDGGDWRPVVIVSRPSFDPATQKETPSYNILPDRVEVTYLISPNVIDTSAIDQGSLNSALAEPGSVVRALALLTLQEINNLRTKTGLANYTMQQFVTALQSKMR
jgi:hypothetical protein